MKIFIIIFDTLRKDHTGKTYGNNWIHTPNFDEFAGDSIVFEKAYPESLPTIPARRAIHTGIRTFPFNHKKLDYRTDDLVESPGWAPIPPQHTHLAEYMRSNGYITSFISSTYHYFKPHMNFHLGFDEWHYIRGHEYDNYRCRYRGKRSDINQAVRDHSINKTNKNRGAVHTQKLLLKKYLPNVQRRICEDEYFPAQTFRTTMDSVLDTERFNNVLYFIDEFDPHEPWDPPKQYLEQYLDDDYDGNMIIQPIYGEKVDYLSDDELKCMRACYAGEVSLCDNWFGYFMQQLKTMEIYDESLIILTSDHGHSLGEHGAIGKIPVYMYPELVDIPLMIKPPGNVNGPKRIKKSYVYHHDILPTLYGFLDKQIPDIFDGKDLSIFVDDDDHLINTRDYITCGMALWTLCKTDDYALITKNDKTDRKLFDLNQDPNWDDNIAEDNPDIYEELFSKIQKDANNDLLTAFESTRFDNFKDWYHNTYLT
jgi:arylsulfatase A-like enzyme